MSFCRRTDIGPPKFDGTEFSGKKIYWLIELLSHDDRVYQWPIYK